MMMLMKLGLGSDCKLIVLDDMKTSGFISYKCILYLSCIIVWSFVACNKQDSRVGEHLGQVVIRVNGTSYGAERIGVNNLKKADVLNKSYEQEIQEVVVPISKDISIVAKLTPVNTNRSLYDTSNKLGAIVMDPELTQDIVYRVVVYNPDGSYKLHKDFAYGDDATILGLDDQVTYTFVAYSVNTTINGDLPLLNTSESLDDVSIQVDNDNEYLMYYLKQLKVSYNQTNNLDVILDHKFSQITTTVSINSSAYDEGARIKAIDAPTINSERASATLKLSDGTLTYGSLTAGKVLTGDAIDAAGVQSYSFDPVNIISEDVSNAVMSFPSFTIFYGFNSWCNYRCKQCEL